MGRSNPLHEKLRVERTGEPFEDSPSSRFRVALLKGEPVNVQEVADSVGSSVENLYTVAARLRQLGFKIDGLGEGTVILRNPDHVVDEGAGREADRETERLRRKIAKLLVEGKVVDASMLKGCNPQRLGSHVRYLRRTMNIERVSSANSSAAYRLVGADVTEEDVQEAEVVADDRHATASNGASSSGSTNGHRLASAPAVLASDGNDDGGEDHQVPARIGLPRVDEDLRVYFVAREDEGTVLVGVLGPDGPLQLRMDA